MASTVSIQLDPAAVTIQAGGRASARIFLLNRGDTVGQYTLSVSGVDPAWVKLDSSEAGVFPGDKASVLLSLRPSAEAFSATYRLDVRAQNLVDGADQATAQLSLTVQRAGDVPVRPPQVGAQADAASSAQPTVLRADRAQPAAPGAVSPSAGPQPSPAQPTVSRSSAAQSAPLDPGKAALRAASPTGQLLFFADREGFRLPPGAVQALRLGLSNTGGVALTVELAVKGPPLSWVGLSSSSLSLPPGESLAAALTITIPAQTPVGSYPLAVVAQPAEDPSQATRLNMMLEVTRPGEISVEISPAQAQGEMGAEFTLQLSQTGQAPLSVNLSARDEGGVLDFSFTPAALSLPVDGKVSSRLSVRARQALSSSETLGYAFTVSAVPSGGGAASASVQGRFTQLRAAPVKLLLQPDEVRDPAQAVFQLRMVNPGQTPLAYRLSAADADNTCDFRFDNPLLNLPARGEAAARLQVTPRSFLSGGEQVHTLRITAQPAAAGAHLVAEVRFIQVAGQPPSLTITPASQTSAGSASYWIQVANPRSVPLKIELQASDGGQLCQYGIDPPLLNIPPMYQASARLEVRPLSNLLPGESRRVCAFSVAGYPEGQAAPIVAQGTLLLVPGFTWRKLLPVAILLLILLAIGAVAVLALLYMRFFR